MGAALPAPRLYARIRERVSALPGVRAVATASSLPMFGVSISMDVHPEGQPERRHEHVASMDVISDDYFRVMEIPRRAGRIFTPDDRDGSTPVVIVSESDREPLLRWQGDRETDYHPRVQIQH